MSEAVSFKGNKDGIVLLLDLAVEFETLCQMIVQKLWDSRNFLGDHTSLIVHSGATVLDQGQRLALKVLLQSLGHEVKQFVPELPVGEMSLSSARTEKATHTKTKPFEEQQEVDSDQSTTQSQSAWMSEFTEVEHYLTQSALAVRKNIRSGQKISYDGTLIIFGDVNAGAELEATGHILVLGILRGVAHAGCKGDKNAVIYANQLNSVQLRIADLIARAPDGENTKREVPEIARIIENYLVIEEV